MKKRGLLIALNGILLLTAIGLFSFRPPCLQEVRALHLEQMSDDGLSAVVHTALYNPNFYGFEVEGLTWYVYLDSLLLGQGKHPDALQIPADSVFEVKTQIRLSGAALKQCLDHTSESDSLTFRVLTAIPFAGFTATSEQYITLPVRELLATGSDQLLRQHTLELVDLQVSKAGVTKVWFKARVGYHNHSAVTYRLLALELALHDEDGRKLGDFAPPILPVKVPADSEHVLETVLAISPVQAGVTGVNQLSTVLQFRLMGTAQVGLASSSLEVPLNLPFHYNLLTQSATFDDAP